MPLPFRKRKYNGSYSYGPAKKKYKSAKAVYKYKANKPGGSRSKSKRKWLLKRARKSRLKGVYGPKNLGSGKDSFSATGLQTVNCLVNYQPPGGPAKLPSSIASQQLVMKRKRTTVTASNQGLQYPVQHICMDNDYYSFPASDVEAEIPNMWSIAQGTMIDAGTYIGLLETSSVAPTEQVMRRQRLYVKSYRCNYTIVNPMNSPIKVSIYTCRFRNDQKGDNGNLPWQVWNSSLTNEDNNDGISMLTQLGFAPFNSAAASNQIGAKPQQAKGFNKKFGIIKQTHMNMDAGQVVQYNMHVKYNKFMEWEDVYPSVIEGTANGTGTSLESTMSYMKDWTVVTMFVFHGAHGEGTATLAGVSVANNQAGIGAAQLNIFYDETTKFYRLPMRSQSVFMKNELRTDITTNFKVAQDEDGDVVAPEST